MYLLRRKDIGGHGGPPYKKTIAKKCRGGLRADQNPGITARDHPDLRSPLGQAGGQLPASFHPIVFQTSIMQQDEPSGIVHHHAVMG